MYIYYIYKKCYSVGLNIHVKISGMMIILADKNSSDIKGLTIVIIFIGNRDLT